MSRFWIFASFKECYQHLKHCHLVKERSLSQKKIFWKLKPKYFPARTSQTLCIVTWRPTPKSRLSWGFMDSKSHGAGGNYWVLHQRYKRGRFKFAFWLQNTRLGRLSATLGRFMKTSRSRKKVKTNFFEQKTKKWQNEHFSFWEIRILFTSNRIEFAAVLIRLSAP